MKRVFAVLLSIALFISASATASGINVLEFLQLYASRLSDIGDVCGMELELTISPSVPIDTSIKLEDGTSIPAWLIAFDHGLLYVDKTTFELEKAYVNMMDVDDTDEECDRSQYKFLAALSALEYPLGSELLVELEHAAGISEIATLAEKTLNLYDVEFGPEITSTATYEKMIEDIDFSLVYSGSTYDYWLTDIAGVGKYQFYIVKK